MIRSAKIFWVLLVSLNLIAFMGGSSLLMASSGKSHATHFFSNKGPQLSHDESGCYVCHADGHKQCVGQPLFADLLPLSVTHVCDNCHSPGGAYDGVDDLQIGAKANWDAGIYEADGTIKAGKE